MNIYRWNDRVLWAALVCFIAAPFGSLLILFGIEQPTLNDLQATYDKNTSGPGHFFAGAVSTMIRIVFAVSAISIGFILTLVGGIRIPKSALTTRKLRDVTWIVFTFAVITCFVIQIA